MFCLHACRQLCFSSRSTNYAAPWFEQVPEILFISGSTGSKKSLETGKYSITLGCASLMRRVFLHYVFFTVNAMFTRHACRQKLVTTTLYFWLARDLKLQPIKSHNFSGRPLSLVPRARETGKLKKNVHLWHRWKNSIDRNLDAGWRFKKHIYYVNGANNVQRVPFFQHQHCSGICQSVSKNY